MFTGIIEEVGTVRKVVKNANSSVLEIEGKIIFEDMHIGDSIAVNGVCLTVTKKAGCVFTADVMTETMRRSSLDGLRNSDKVNLERAMSANGRFGGHFVSGHIDGTGKIIDIKQEENTVWITISAQEKELCYIVEKGSIAIDGISLTVTFVDENCFKICVIPHTKGYTTLLHKKLGDIVNLECDIIGKYVEKLVDKNSTNKDGTNKDSTNKNGTNKSKIDAAFLAEHGFM